MRPWVKCLSDWKKLLWWREFTGGPDRQVRSAPLGRLPEIATGGSRPILLKNSFLSEAKQPHEKSASQIALQTVRGHRLGVREPPKIWQNPPSKSFSTESATKACSGYEFE